MAIANYRYGTTQSELDARGKSKSATTAIRTGKEVDTEFPEYDLGKVKELTGEQFAVGAGKVQRAVRGVTAGRYGTPTARREAIRGAIEGYGEALGPLQASAARTGRTLYEPEYRGRVRKFEDTRREEEFEEAKSLEAGGDTTPYGSFREASLRMATRPGFDAPAEGQYGPTKLPGPVAPTTQVNPVHWPGGATQQAQAKKFSKKHGIPLSSFTGTKDPATVVKNLVKYG